MKVIIRLTKDAEAKALPILLRHSRAWCWPQHILRAFGGCSESFARKRASLSPKSAVAKLLHWERLIPCRGSQFLCALFSVPTDKPCQARSIEFVDIAALHRKL
jgi:hypothetical protein